MRKLIGSLIALLAIACSHAAGSAEKEKGFGELSVDQVVAMVGKPGVYVYDNNRHEEYVKGHVPTAKWVDYDNVTAGDLPADKEATLIFYCHNEH